jgi:hypothetical protein
MMYKYYILLYLFLAVLICNVKTAAQEGTPPPTDFVVGAFIASTQNPAHTLYNNYDQILDCGLNSVWQNVKKTDSSNLIQLADFPYVYAANDTAPHHTPVEGNKDWVSYFTHAKYYRWEAEGDPNFDELTEPVGIKHNGIGYHAGNGWSSGDTPSDTGKYFIDGPNYTQYIKPVYTNRHHSENLPIQYKAVFRIKLGEPQEGSFNVAEIEVVVKDDRSGQDTILTSLILTSDTLSTSYQDFVLSYNYNDFIEGSSGYQGTQPPPPGSLSILSKDGAPDTSYINFNKKVQFRVKRLAQAVIIVDYIEVYDEEIWENSFIGEVNYTQTVNRISTYNQQFYELGTKLKYFGTIDEPMSFDSYIPIKKVQEILDLLNTGRDLLVHWYPNWNGMRDGVKIIEKWVSIAQPKKFMFWYAPFTCDDTQTPCEPYAQDYTLNNFRTRLQESHLVQPDFFVTLQSFGVLDTVNDNYIHYLHPSGSELSAETMLSLAHGVNGVFYEEYYTRLTWWYGYRFLRVENLVDLPWNGYQPDFLRWNKVKELASRLNGTLGKTLMTLDYTDVFLRLCRYPSETWLETGEPVDEDYLTLSSVSGEPTPPPLNFHAGFFDHPTQTENNYFLLANLLTSGNSSVNIRVADTEPYFTNMRFRNIEPEYDLDTTFTDSISIDLEFPAGEGYLYQVAPVVKYGGRLIYNETISNEITLVDEMIIENGAVLTINSTYTAKANIIVKNGSIIKIQNGKIKFEDGTKLIIEGTANINGNPLNKLALEFTGPETENGIVIDPEGSLTISNCIIENAETGIKAELYAKYLNAQYVDFVDCISSSVTILGQMGGGETPPPQVKYCNMSNSHYGISAANLSTLIIQENNITNTELGIYLSNVSNIAAIGNTIISNTESMPGLLAVSTGGMIRTNIIKGHTDGISLGNSSPDVGGNDITDCQLHGMYIGSGSLPNMVGRLVYNQNNHIWYPVSGYNEIYENGGYGSGGLGDDGSEILFSNANAIMREGCNLVYDDRVPSGNLITTIYLMSNSAASLPIEVRAEYNFWGYEPPYPLEQRFNNLTVYYDPNYEEPCPLPDKSGEKLVTKTSTGEVIDTLYPVERNVGALTESEILYSQADELFITGQIESAEVFYNQIISSNDTLVNKLEAYGRKYEIGKLLKRNPEYFSELHNTYESLITTTEDSLLKKIFGQLSKLCIIGQEEYVPAIGEFDAIVQQNPGSEEAVYAEIDALTTALLVEGNDSTMNKGSLGKYLIKTSGDYFGKLDGILRKNFGSEKETEEKEILPEEYTLYQNYPNPFNPVTIIKYDLPKAGEVELVVYDILGRKVKTLVNQTQQAGRYDIQFNASSLASGVYIYQLRTKDFVNSKKMILLK